MLRSVGKAHLMLKCLASTAVAVKKYAGQMCEYVQVRDKFICAVLMNKISGLAVDYVHMYVDMYIGR